MDRAGAHSGEPSSPAAPTTNADGTADGRNGSGSDAVEDPQERTPARSTRGPGNHAPAATDRSNRVRQLALLNGVVANVWLLVPVAGVLVLAGFSQWGGPTDTLRAAAAIAGASVVAVAAAVPNRAGKAAVALVGLAVAAAGLTALAFPSVQRSLDRKSVAATKPKVLASPSTPAAPQGTAPAVADASPGSPQPARSATDPVSMPGADLTGTKLRTLHLQQANLAGARLDGAAAAGLALEHADLAGASMRGADLRGSDLAGADLDGADLSGADLAGACLRGAQLADTTVSGTDFTGADVSGASLPAYLTPDLGQDHEVR